MKKSSALFLGVICFLFGLACSIMASEAYADGAGVLPNKNITSGATRPVDIKTLCTTSTKLVRNVPEAEKKAVYKSYGMSGDDRTSCTEGFEIDHLVSLELGGSNEQKNLWPQSYCGAQSAHVKDKLENKLHALACSGKMPLKDAQTCIASDWVACSKKVGL